VPLASLAAGSKLLDTKNSQSTEIKQIKYIIYNSKIQNRNQHIEMTQYPSSAMNSPPLRRQIAFIQEMKAQGHATWELGNIRGIHGTVLRMLE